MRANPTPNNILVSFAILGKSPAVMREVLKASQTGEINIMLDSGAFSAFGAKGGLSWVNLRNYCRWLERVADDVEKYIMLDVIGNEPATQRNFDIMVKHGFNPMYVYTMASRDEQFLKHALSVNPNVCVAGGATTKGDWLIQRYQRVLKLSDGKAKIHGLAFVSFPRMLQCGLASVDSSSWAVSSMKYANIPVFDQAGMHMIERRRFVAGLKQRNAVCMKTAEKMRLTVADFMHEPNFHTTASVPFYCGVRSYMEMQRYCWRRGLRLFFAISPLTQLRAVQYFSRNWQRPDYKEFQKFVTQDRKENA